MLRSIIIDAIPLATAEFIQMLMHNIFIFAIFAVISLLISNHSYDRKNNNSDLPFCLSVVVGLTLILISDSSIITIKGLILTLLLLYASISDLKTRKVSDCISIMILILAFVGFEVANLSSMLLGALVVFVPQFALAVISPSRAFGGADLKISTALAFLLGSERGIFALIVGLFFAVIFMTIYNKANDKNKKESFPLVPFLSIGAMLAFII